MPGAMQNPSNQLILACLLGVVGFFLLLPKPRLSSRALGTFLCVASIATLGHYLSESFGKPVGHIVPDLLFWMFSAGAVGFSVLLVTQRNPARGAIAFAFVILSSCGLFLLLAAPFLMAATIIIYAGAIIVTFLFVLMLSHVSGPSDENDRTREPLLGSLAGFAFIGLILFSLLQSKPKEGSVASLTPPLTTENREQLTKAVTMLDEVIASPENQAKTLGEIHDGINKLIVDTMTRHKSHIRMSNLGTDKPVAGDPRVNEFLNQTQQIHRQNEDIENMLMGGTLKPTDVNKLKELRATLIIYSGNGHLPARNVGNIGYLIYSDQILAVEMAGTLLLVATIGAVAIAGRRKESAA